MPHFEETFNRFQAPYEIIEYVNYYRLNLYQKYMLYFNIIEDIIVLFKNKFNQKFKSKANAPRAH